MKLRIAYAALVMVSIVSACGHPIEPTEVGLTGTYRSTVFVLVGPADGPDSVNKRGGYIELSLRGDSTVSGRMVIPYQGGPTVDTTIAGTYSVAHDTVRFQTNIGYEINGQPWVHIGNELHADGEGRGEPFSIVMKHQ